MIKFLVDIITLILCCGIIFIGGTKTFENSKAGLNDFMADFELVLNSTPEIPDVDGGDTDNNEGDNSGENNNGGNVGGDKVEDDDVPGDEEDTNDKPGEAPEVPSTTTQTTETIKGMIDNYNPAVAETTQNMMTETIENSIPDSNPNKDVITDAIGTYFDNLYAAIGEKKDETDDMDDEAAEQAKTEFAEKESAALNGIVTIVGVANSGEADEEKITESVDAILDSTVCLETVTTTITEDENMKQDIQKATENMNDQTKTTIKEKIQEKIEENRNSENYDPQKEDQYKALAELFGIKIN